VGDMKFRFCDEDGNIYHLFFSCSKAKYIGSVVSWSFGVNTRPGNFT
jgi:hypothetical protein